MFGQLTRVIYPGGAGGAVIPFDCTDSTWGLDGILYQEGGVWYNQCKAFYDVDLLHLQYH